MPRKVPRDPSNMNGRCSWCGRAWDDHDLKGEQPKCVPPKDK